MKIIMPVEEKKLDGDLCISFARAPLFLIYDTKSKENHFVENTAASSVSGAGIKAAQFIVDSGVDALLTPRCGENALEVMTAANISIYQTKSVSIPASIDAFIKGELLSLHSAQTGLHHQTTTK